MSLLLGMLSCGFVLVSTAAQQPSQARLAAIVDSVARAAIGKGKSPGLSIAIARGGKILVASGYGFADLENRVPVSDSSVFRIASVTKSFTAAAVMLLVEQGRLSLDDPLSKWMPQWPRYQRPVTLRNLLNHTSGIHDPNHSAPTATPMRLDRAQTVHDSVLEASRADTLSFEPGTSWQYSNAGYVLLGLIIEKASGQSYGAFLDQHIFRPLQLRGTSYCGMTAPTPNRTQGYTTDRSGRFIRADSLDMRGPFAAGSICSTAADLATWGHALQSGRVVSRRSYRLMTEMRTFASDKPRYGFGLSLGSIAGRELVGHNGSINGYTSRLAMYPEDSLVLVVLANTQTFVPDPLERGLASVAVPLPDPAPENLPVSRAEIARFAGSYRSEMYGFTVSVTSEDVNLFATVPGLGRFVLRKQREGVFVSADDHYTRLRFVGTAPKASRLEISDPQQNAVLARL